MPEHVPVERILVLVEPRRIASGLFAAVVVVSIGTSCGDAADNGARLIWPGPNSSASITQPDIAAGRPYSVGSMMVCASGTRRPVRILAVTPTDPTGSIEVTEFATRPNPFLSKPVGESFGSGFTSLTRGGFTVTGRQVAEPCGPKRPGTGGYPEARTELGVTLVRSGSATGSDRGVTVTYEEAAGTRRTMVVGLAVTLCSPVATRTFKCGR